MRFLKHDCEKDGHKFEPRYDLTMPLLSDESLEILELAFIPGQGSFRDQVYNKHYVHDICVKCGETVSRGGVVQKQLPNDYEPEA